YRSPDYFYGPSLDYDYIHTGPAAPSSAVALSGDFPATLVLEFPAPARVWLDDKELSGETETVRTITSPVLRPGQQYTFHVRARWKANNKTFEYTREAALGP